MKRASEIRQPRDTDCGAGHPADAEWRDHPTVNSANPCPWCGIRALHEQHCKQICLACGWYRSCVD